MEENHFKALSFLLKFVLLLQLVYSINHQFGADASIQPEQHDRLNKVEAQTRRHENEISLLKTETIEDRKEIRQLRERVALLEDSTFSNASSSEKILTRLKRPVRLLPSQVLRPKKKKTDETEEEASTKRFYGPPTSCDELNKLRYTLNGYYLIKGKEKLNSNRIQVVYCQFHQPSGENHQIVETWIGNVEVKTKAVHFYVQRDTKFNTPGALTFNVEQLNVGGAMNLTSGDFIAPVNGIYHFEFRCLKDRLPYELGYSLHVQQRKSLTTAVVKLKPRIASTHMANLSYPLPGSITASLKLKASDIVSLVSVEQQLVQLYDGRAHYTQFAGWLVEEDLMLA